MGAEDDLWADLHALFDTDDGSLPEVVFIDPPCSALQPLFAFLMERGCVDRQTLWDPALEADVPVADVPDAGELVASGRIPSFHAGFNGIEVDGVKIPRLGAFFVEHEVALDYRMGEHWTPPALVAFVQLLDAMCALAPGAALQARAASGLPPDPRFAQALDRYLCSP